MENITPSNFIEQAIVEDIKEKGLKKIVTRFPPEPNGYTHIGHCKAICIDFLTAEKFKGYTNLRMDDTNPSKESEDYVKALMDDIKWLGFKWKNLYYASDYYDFLYDCAIDLIKQGKAYVCELSADEISQSRGTLTEPGKESPYRNRSIEENLRLFEEMKAGKFADGEKTLRAKIDMASPNINMRDPVIYRIMHVPHFRQGNKWCIYPMYDFAHPLSDAHEGITHSLCSLEFEDHRPLYNWFVDNCRLITGVKPRQIEFARLNIAGTVISKRYFIELVDGAALLTPLDRYNGNWPEEVKIVIEKDGAMSSYRLKLADYVGADDEFYLNDPEWSLEWSEEFNTDDIDWSVWEYCPRQDAEWANKMVPREDLVFQKDGNLEVWAKVADSGNFPYVTGGIWGEGLKSFDLGRIDVRMKKDFAQSFWPAVWMMPDANIGWPDGGEIDIMEHLNYDPIVYQTVHSYYTENVSKNDPIDHSTTIVDTREYHIYSVEVFEDRLVYYVDNKPQLVYQRDDTKEGQYPFRDYDFYMILSAQLGGNWPGEATGKDLPAAMYVDFVRYYAPVAK